MRSRPCRQDPIRWRLADHRRRLRQTEKPRRIARWDAEHRRLFTGHASQSRTTAARRWRTLIRLVVRMRRLRVE
jgi:hypothetical protein